MEVVYRRRKTQEHLQEDVDVGRRFHVAAPSDVSHVLRGIVDDDAEVVAGADVLALEDNVAPALGTGIPDLWAVAQGGADDGEGQHAGFFHGPIGVEAELDGVTAFETLDAFLIGKMLAGAGIDGGAVRVGVFGLGGDIGAGAEAGIDEIALAEAIGGLGVELETLGLDKDWFGPGKAEPFEVLENGFGKFGFTAGDVDVFDAQKHCATNNLGGLPGYERRKGVTEVEEPIGARGETKNWFF